MEHADVEQPESLQGHLRPYQRMGLSWLVFLDTLGSRRVPRRRHGSRQDRSSSSRCSCTSAHSVARGGGPGTDAAARPDVADRQLGAGAAPFRAEPDRPRAARSGSACRRRVRPCGRRSDVVITTYGLVIRDLASLKRIRWRRVVLDEAQYIKNPPTKQTTAIRSLGTDRRVALTGTPVENRLSELWSIMEFCNPGYLGSGRRVPPAVLGAHRAASRSAAGRACFDSSSVRSSCAGSRPIRPSSTICRTVRADQGVRQRCHAEQAALYEQVVGVDALPGRSRPKASSGEGWSWRRW